MRYCNYEKTIEVDNLYYEMHVSKSNDISFALIGGRFADGSRVLHYEDSFYHNATKYFVNNKVKNPKKVIKCFLDNVVQYIYEHRPPYVQFSSMESKRTKIYQRLLKRVPSNYEPISYGAYDNDRFILIRKPNT